ncbi:tRNA-(ms[2]io[6]A)-hydroxylase [bacterium]|nr:tRNA-(ms[2]io[6]A)-hydroxylase [bacterium]
MKLNLEIAVPSSEAWINCVLENFNDFLIDHADCERKASSMAMSFVAKYPDRLQIIPELIATGIEELEHFRDVYEIMEKRGIALPERMAEDVYVKELIKLCRHTREERFIDRMCVASVVETRGAERFKMVADNLEESELKAFYKRLWTSEAKHGHIFVKMLLHYFTEDQVYPRLEYLTKMEGEIMRKLPIRPALH